MTAHKKVLLFCVCFCIFAIVGTRWGSSAMLFPACFFLCLFSIVSIRQKTAFATLFFVVLFAVSIAYGRIENIRSHSFPLEGKVSVRGVIDREPDRRIGETYYRIRTEHGRLRAIAPAYPVFSYGDIVAFSCSIQDISASEGRFRMREYLLSQGIHASCRTSDAVLLGSGEGNILYSSILNIKSLIARGVYRAWTEPYASFAAGVLYGYRGGLGELGEQFRRTGVSHIVAVSGYNVSVLAAAVMGLLSYFCVNKKRALLYAVAGICIFVIFTGASASVVRAGIMGALVLLARVPGRRASSWKLLLYAAVGMALVNPYTLFFDPGFQLSWCATAGLLYLSPIIERKLVCLPALFGLREALSSTLAALLAVMPISLFLFESFSIFSPVVNMLVVPVVPWIMTFGMVGVLGGIIHPFLGIIAGVPAFLLMRYVVFVVSSFSNISFSFVSVPWFGYVCVWSYYTCLFVWFLGRHSYPHGLLPKTFQLPILNKDI